MDAAELRRRTGVTLRDRVQRVRASAILALQTAIAAGIAWYVAHDVLGHVQPFFAPIAAVITLAISLGQRMRRAIEIVLGNACGILLGELLLLLIGRGAWQVALVVGLAIVIAIFIGGSSSLVAQAASSGALVATMIPLTGDYFFTRFVDAVVGGLVALLVMALLLPLNPLTVVGRAAGTMLDALAEGLTETAEALAVRDSARAQDALDKLREAEAHLRAFADALTAGREISTVAPLRWRKRNALREYVDSYDHVARALRNSRVLVRRSVALIADDEPIPPTLIAAVRSLADAVVRLRRELAEAVEPEAARSAALQAVRNGGEAYLTGVGFSGSVVVAQIRSIGVDLLRASGLPKEDADRIVRRAFGKAANLPPPSRPGLTEVSRPQGS